MAHSKYNVGDKVKIRSLKWYKKNKNDVGDVEVTFLFLEAMSKYCGMIAFVTGIYATDISYSFEDSYKLDIDRGNWQWGNQMFEDIKKQRRKKLKKIKTYGNNSEING